MADSSALIESFVSSLSGLKNQLSNEVRKRQTVIKPIERILWALKNPHRNAVTLYESTVALSKAGRDFSISNEYDSVLNQLHSLAKESLADLEFSFAHDLRIAFEEKGIKLEGPPHELVGDLFVIKVDMASRQVHITFSKQPVTDKKVKLDVEKVLSTYQKAKKEICERNTNNDEILKALFEAYQRVLKLSDQPIGARAPIVDCYREMVLIKQPNSFRKTPSKTSFVDYPKTHFIYDMLQARRENKLITNGYRLNFGTSTIEVGADSTKALFLAVAALQGQYMKEIYFTVE